MSSFGGDDDLTIHASVDNDASPELRDIRDELRGVGVQADRTGRTASRSSRGFNVMGKAAKVAAFGAKVAFGAALAGGYALVRLLSASFGEAREAQKVGAKTAAILKATGHAAKVSAGDVGRLATAISNKVGIDDEAIQTGSNLLLTFKQIRNEAGKGNKIFDRATKAAVDLSAAGFGSIESGSKMLGKALNDPLKGITALSRAGVTFTQGQQDTIAKMVKANDILGAQKIILGEVEAQVGGVAKAQATWGDKAGVVFGNIEERLGTALLPLLDDLGRWFVQTGGPQLDKWVGIFERRGVPALQRFADQARPLAREYLPEMWDVLKQVFGTIKDMAPYVGDVLKGFNDLPAWAKSAIITGAGIAALGKKTGVTGGTSSAGTTGLAGRTPATPLWVRVVGSLGVGGRGGVGGGGAVVAGGGAAAATRGAGVRAGAGKFIKGGGAAAVGLTIAAAFNDDVQAVLNDPMGELKAEALWPWTEGPFSDKKATEAEKNTKRSVKALRGLLITPLGPKGAKSSALEELLTGATGKSDGLGKSLEDTGRKKVAPQITTPGMDKAISSSDALFNMLTGVDRVVAKPTISVQGVAAAQSAIASVQSSLNNFGGFFGGSSSGNSTGSSGSSHGPNWHHLYDTGTGKGGKGGKHDTTPRVAPRSKSTAMAGGGVNIGELHVHAEGANSDVDVMDATTRALDDYFRDRQERR